MKFVKSLMAAALIGNAVSVQIGREEWEDLPDYYSGRIFEWGDLPDQEYTR